jgi:hypothetical protein
MTAEFDYSHMTPGNVMAAASIAAEAIRYVNHATRGGPDAVALESPADVDAVLADLEILALRLPQLLGQIGGWLVAECRAGRLQIDSGSWASSASIEAMAVAAVRQYLTEASSHAEALGEVLHEARQVTAALAAAPGGEES